MELVHTCARTGPHAYTRHPRQRILPLFLESGLWEDESKCPSKCCLDSSFISDALDNFTTSRVHVPEREIVESCNLAYEYMYEDSTSFCDVYTSTCYWYTFLGSIHRRLVMCSCASVDKKV